MSKLLIPPEKEILIATQRERKFVRSLAQKFSNQVGFLPDQALDWFLDSQNVRLCMENGEPSGYILGRESLRWNLGVRPIFQAAICFDAQRRQNGLALVSTIAKDACEAGQMAIQCCCREGLEANLFWKAAGFEAICNLTPKNTRKKDVICWRLQLTTYRPPWFETPPPFSGHRSRKTTCRP